MSPTRRVERGPVIGALFILLPLVGVLTWMFFRYAPMHGDRKALLAFNLLSLAVATLLVVVWTVRTWVVMSPTNDAAWWPVISFLGGLIIVPVVLGVAALLRRYVVFRP